jgi:hypothetical protein
LLGVRVPSLESHACIARSLARFACLARPPARLLGSFAGPVGQVRVCNVYYVLDRVNRRDRFSMKKPFRSSARGASFHTKHGLRFISTLDLIVVSLYTHTHTYAHANTLICYFTSIIVKFRSYY